MLNLILSAVIGYFVGSISFAIVISKTFLKGDVRTKGSGNAGATNVARVYGMGIGVLTLLGDALKTVVSMELGRYLGGETGMVLAGAACFIGHSWPIYYNFKGGKGVTVGAAMALVIDLRFFLILAVIFFSVVLSTRIVSLSSITVAAAYPIVLIILKMSLQVILLGAFVGITVIILHIPNIKRLLAGTEPKFKPGSARDVSKDSYGGKDE